jgi:glycosyltransferase involved in cell wall biosynthesis
MRILFVQPSIPIYRVPFFLHLASEFEPFFSVLHSEGDLGNLTPSLQYTWSKCIGKVIKIGFGCLWQNNLLRYKIQKDDIVIISGNPRYISSIIFILKVRILGGKIVWWSHYRSSTSKKWRMKLRLRLMKMANGIMFYTQDEVDEYLSTIKQKEDRSIVGLNNGIDMIPIKLHRKKYDADLRRREILFLGRISQKANFKILLEALKHPNLINVTLNVIGNDDRYSFLNGDQSTVFNASKINWYGKLTDEQEISNIANRCRIFIYPGAVGLSLIHAMAYGLPCLLHSDRLKHMPEIAAFKTGITGLTFHPSDAKDLAVKLSTMISNINALNTMSENCLKAVENEFNTSRMAQKFIKFIKELK